MTKENKENKATVETLGLNEVQEVETDEVTGNFRGYWRDCPEREVNGIKYPARRQFKFQRTVQVPVKDADGKVTGMRKVRQCFWVAEADARAWNVQEGVKYAIVVAAGLDMAASSSNGDEQYLDEFNLDDPTIVSINGQTVPPLK